MQSLRRFDVGVIVVIVLACLGAVYKFARLEGHVDALGPDKVENAIKIAVQRIKAEAGAYRVPVGAILPFSGTTNDIPLGWLLCDGTPLPDDAQYAKLREILAAADWDNGETALLLPDLRGRFLRGLDHPKGSSAANLDPDCGIRAVGSAQKQTRGHHQHTSGDMIAQIAPSRGEVPLNLGGASWTAANCLKGVKAAQPDPGNNSMASGVRVSGSTSLVYVFDDEENRPENCAVNYIIKF